MRDSRLAASYVALAAMLLSMPLSAKEDSADKESWLVDASMYVLGAGLDGTIGIGGNTADIDVSFSDILEDLEMGGMGSLRFTRGRWAFTTEVIYMGLGASDGPFGVDVDQWMVEPSASFHVSDRFETIVGLRYMNISAEIRGPFGRSVSGTVDWWDPFIGARLTLPFADAWTFNLRGDVGGFDVGADLAWQIFPYLNWQFGERASMQAGYRWLSVDYDEGSGASEFVYDVVTEGAQLGMTFRF